MHTATASRWRALAVVGVIIAIVVLLLLLRNCHPAAVVQAPPFDYFVAKAAELGNDPNRILTYVRDQVPTLAYRGDVKGALGSLWNGAASPEEKVLLADALLAAANNPKHTTLDEVCPTRDKAIDAPAPLNLLMQHRTDAAAGPTDTKLYDGPAGPLVGDVNSVELLSGGKTHIVIRAAKETPVDIAIPDDADGESLVFTWKTPGAPATSSTSTVREIWHRGNRSSTAAHAEGDRHDFVIIPCAIGPYVREKEPVILRQRGRESSIEASAYLALLDFAMTSDASLAAIEKKMNVTAQRSEPRVLIWSRYKTQVPGTDASALDLRIDRPGFSGDRIAAYRATQARSLLQSALAAEFVEHHSAMPADSAFGVFTLLKSNAPATAGQRFAQIRDSLQSLAGERSPDSVAIFSAREDSAVPPKSSVEVRWTLDGFDVRPNPTSNATRFKTIQDATLAVETTLLAAEATAHASPDYLLETQITRQPISLVQPDSRFLFQWTDDALRTEQQIRVLQLDNHLVYRWRVQAGVLPVAGTREVLPDALSGATTHNPWYRAGSSMQKDATSFVLSRKVYDAVKNGKGIELRMLGPLGTKTDAAATRPVDFADTLSPGPPVAIEPTINGKPEKLSILPATIRGKPLAILDDSASPVGMAHAIKSVVTAIRCRIVDTRGEPICSARVSVSMRAQPTDVIAIAGPTAADGIILLPPPDVTDSYGKVVLTVTFPDMSTQRVDADLTAPGLSTVTIKVERPTIKLLYLCKNERRQLEALKLPGEVKRHALRDLDAGHMVVIPAQEVGDGMRTYTAYYACDNQTGDCVGVMENGLCGAATCGFASVPMAASDATTEPQETTADTSSQEWPKAISTWHTAAQAHSEEISPQTFTRQTLRALRGWADATDVAGTFAQSTENTLADRLGAVLKLPALNASGAVAKPAFQIGYVTTTRYLSQEAEKPDGK